MTAKTWAIILGIVAFAGLVTSAIFIVKYKATNNKLIKANEALKALGAPEVKTAPANPAAAAAAGEAMGTAVEGSPAGTNAVKSYMKK